MRTNHRPRSARNGVALLQVTTMLRDASLAGDVAALQEALEQADKLGLVNEAAIGRRKLAKLIG